jgi:cytochrome P450
VVFHVLGVPDEDVETVKQGSANRLLFMFGRPTEDEQVDIATGMASFWRYCEGSPRTDVRILVRTSPPTWCTPRANGEPLTQQEVSTILFGLLLAGHETTTNLRQLRAAAGRERCVGGVAIDRASFPARWRKCCASTRR